MSPRERSAIMPDAADDLASLAPALDGGRLSTRYQPIVSLADRRPVGIETLVRLEHSKRGTVPPDLFVPQMEQAGLAIPLTRTVTRQAFADWGDGRLAARDWWLAINFTLDVLMDGGTLEWLEQARAEAGIAPSSIVIELTESRVLSQLALLRERAACLRDRGYRLAIDDVGPEIRDHRPLLDMRFTSMKLDKDLVHESCDSELSHAFLMRAMADAADAELVVVAEGVEDAEIWDRMRDLGVDLAQGFLIARPLPASAIAAWHRQWSSRHGL